MGEEFDGFIGEDYDLDPKGEDDDAIIDNDDLLPDGVSAIHFCLVCNGPSGSVCLQTPTASKEECDKLGGIYQD